MKHQITNVATGETTEREFSASELSDLETYAWNALRVRRNDLLAACDWTVAADSPVDVAAWTTYRQALRDLPAHTTDPFNVVWPTPPA